LAELIQPTAAESEAKRVADATRLEAANTLHQNNLIQHTAYLENMAKRKAQIEGNALIRANNAKAQAAANAYNLKKNAEWAAAHMPGPGSATLGNVQN